MPRRRHKETQHEGLYRPRDGNISTTRTTVVDEVREWWAYERMPPLLRRLMQLAEYNFALEPIYRDWLHAKRRGTSARDFCIAVRKAQQRRRRLEISVAYGPDHPQLAEAPPCDRKSPKKSLLPAAGSDSKRPKRNVPSLPAKSGSNWKRNKKSTR